MLGKSLGFVASKEALVHDVARLRARVETEPYRSALQLVWAVEGAEGLYSGVLGNADFAGDYKRSGPAPVNTDDRTYLEFAFARSVGETTNNALDQMRQLAVTHRHREPQLVNGSVDWGAVEERRVTRVNSEAGTVPLVSGTDSASTARQAARFAYATEDLAKARSLWLSQSAEPTVLGDRRLVAESFALAGDPRAVGYIESLRAMQPVEAEALLALYAARIGKRAESVDHFVRALRTYRVYPWANRALIMRSFDLVGSSLDDQGAATVFAELREPFAVRVLDIARLEVRSAIGMKPGFEQYCVDALAPLEPNVPWNETLLRGRDQCYSNFNPALAGKAHADLEKFLSNAKATR